MDTKSTEGLARRLDRLAASRLRARDDLNQPGWRFWERRTLNLHRVVGLWSRPGPAASAGELELAVRDTVARHFRRAWWRGLAFGVVVECDTLLLSPEQARAAIDGRENARGTWQWVVQIAAPRRAVVGMHTWMEGYLSPLYRELLDGLAQEHEVARLVKERDGLMRILTATKPRLFPEFQNELSGATSGARGPEPVP